MTMFRFLLAKHNASHALFAGGLNTSSAFLQTTERYYLANNVTTSGASLSVSRRGLVASSNSAIGCIRGGTNDPSGPTVLNTTDKFVFASNSSSSGQALGTGCYQPGAHSISDVGCWAGGYNAGNLSNNQKYTYSTDSNSSALALSVARYSLQGIGNQQYAWFCGGISAGVGYRQTVERYEFSSDAMSTRTSLGGTENHSGASSGNNQFAIMFFGNLSSSFAKTTRYTFATEAQGSETNIRTISNGGAGGNSICGVWAFGGNSPGSGSGAVATSNVYVWSTSAISTGTSLTTARSETTGCGSEPGHFR